jgi:hypothetical protein
MPATVAEPCDRPGCATLIADTGSGRLKGPGEEATAAVAETDSGTTATACAQPLVGDGFGIPEMSLSIGTAEFGNHRPGLRVVQLGLSSGYPTDVTADVQEASS